MHILQKVIELININFSLVILFSSKYRNDRPNNLTLSVSISMYKQSILFGRGNLTHAVYKSDAKPTWRQRSQTK